MTQLAKHFRSTTDFASWMRGEKMHHGRYTGGYGSNNDARNDQGLKHLQEGNDRNVEEAKKLMRDLTLKIDVPTLQWETHVVGFLPNIPGFVAGTPDQMWTRTYTKRDRTPLRVWVGVTSSGGIDERDLVRRGCALAAFALAMQNTRPVHITPYVNLGLAWSRRSNIEDAVISWDVGTSPLGIARLMASVSEPEVTRYVGIAACYFLNPKVDGDWHSDYDDEAKMRQHLGAKPDDLYLPSIHLHDPILSNPVEWVRTQVAKYTKED